MTLHWWMHWFWVTMLLVVFASINSSAAPQSEELQHITTEDETKPERRGRAMYYTKTTILTTSTPQPSPLPPSTENTTQSPKQELNTTTVTEETYQEPNNTLEVAHPAVISLTNQTASNIKPENVTETEIIKLEEDTSVNRTDSDNSTPKLKNLTTEVKEIDSGIDVAESRIVSEPPLSLETSFLQTRLPPVLESSRRILNQERSKSMDTGAIAGISFAGVVVVALVGSTGVVVYRRRGGMGGMGGIGGSGGDTLHDKCSNPDSTHYLDDSTIRDNSEEMYSLDNDSFLNSLEAMTIQNYWTDTVKHTKL